MPSITMAGTYTKDTPGFEFLSWEKIQAHGPRPHVLLFSNGDIGSSLEIQYIDDEGTPRTLENGSLKKLPASLDVTGLQIDLQIAVTGSPNFNLTAG